MTESNKKNYTEPYEGAGDLYPEDMAMQNHIFKVMRETAKSFGYNEYSASILEPTELYDTEADEYPLKEQVHKVKDGNNKEKEISLRPEITPTLARMVAHKKDELLTPLRFYSISNIFRYNENEDGELREHWQLNADLFGAPGIEAEAEMISFAYQLMTNFGAKSKDFKIKVNNRQLINKIVEHLGLKGEELKKLIKLISNKKETPESDFEKQLSDLLGEESKRLLEWLDLTEFSTFKYSLPEELSSSAPAEELLSLFELLKKLGIDNVEFDSSMIRRLNHCTGIIFEVYDTDPEMNSPIFGGGRYDDLLSIFGVEDLPVIGFSMEDTPVKRFLETHNLSPAYTPSAQVYISTASADDKLTALDIADSLRRSGVNTAVNLIDKDVDEQIQLAKKKSIPFIMFVSEKAKQKSKYMVKSLNTENEKELSEDEIPDFVKNKK